MLSSTFQSFALAFQNIRTNFFHTFLSVLGIVIGVAALVATFSLIDGLEKFAREQISEKTSVNALIINTETSKNVNNISVRKDTYQIIDYEQFTRLKSQLPLVTKANFENSFNKEIQVAGVDTAIAAIIQCVAESPIPDSMIQHGHNLLPNAVSQREKVAVINQALAKLIVGSEQVQGMVGKTLTIMGHPVTVVGIAKSKRKEVPPMAAMPISLLNRADIYRSPASMVLEVAKTEEVATVKDQVKAWLKTEYGEQNSDFQVISQDFWADQTKMGFTIFRVVMGLIIGLSVLVGGVGVMNVLLISVTERTAEIGLRKALGAKRGDIRRLFLAESITVSAFGSILGLLVGASFAMAAIPIIRFFVDVPFSAVLTWNTILVICVVAVLIGIIFGTYPAVKAARLDPVEALRRE